jgi:hypothetical protein
MVGPSILQALRGLEGDLAKAQAALHRSQILPCEDVARLYLRVKLVSIFWIWEIQTYQGACTALADRHGERLNFRALRARQTLVKLVYPSSSTDGKSPVVTAQAAAAEGVLVNRFVAFLLTEADIHFRAAVPPAGEVARFRSSQALVRALDLLVRAIRTFMALGVQPLDEALGRPRRIHAAVNPTVHSRDFYEMSRLTFFRELPSNVFYDYEPHSAIIAFRTALERKLRESILVHSFQLRRAALPWHRKLASIVRRALSDASRGVWRPRQNAVTPSDTVRVINVSDIFGAWNELGLQIIARA